MANASGPTARRWRLVALSAACSVGLALLAPGVVRAHAELVASSPEANAAVPEAPPELRLFFSEPIDPATASVLLLDESQAAVDGLGDVRTDAADSTVNVPLPSLEPGIYTVNYQVVSAVDGHATAGIFAFRVDPSGIEPPPAIRPGSSAPAADGAAIAARWMALAGALVAFGTLVFWLRSARSALAAAGGDAAATAVPWLLVAFASFATFAALAIYLTLAARPVTEALGGGHGGHGGAGFPLDFAAPFGWTPFAIAMRLALGASLAGFVVGAGRAFALDDGRRQSSAANPTSEVRLGWSVAALLATGLLGMSLAGHAASLGGPLFAGLDWLHLLAGGAWLGGLPALAVIVRRAGLAGATPRSVVAAALRTHSGLALVAAPIVAITGLANSPLVLGAGRELVASAYGNLLVAKALLFSVALAIGAANHFVVRGRHGRRLAALLAAELTVGALAVMTAAAMVTIQPASSRQPVLSSSALSAAHLYGTAGPSSVHISVELPTPGDQRYHVAVEDQSTGQPGENVQNVILLFSPPEGGELPEQRVELEPQARPGLFAATGAYTPVVGDWQLTAIIRRQGEPDEATTFDLQVIEPLPPQRVPPPDAGLGVPAPLAAMWGLLPGGTAAWLPALVLLAGAGALFAGAQVLRRRGRSVARLLGTARVGLLVIGLLAALAAGSRAVVQAANAPPAAEIAAANPVPADDASLARGDRIYLANCSACHGLHGAGDGPTAVGMLPGPSHLAALVPQRTDGELAYRVANGMVGTPMPGFATILSENERWDLVNYLRARWGTD